MAIKKTTPVKADPNVTAEHFQILEIMDLSIPRRTATIRYGLYSTAETKANNCPPFDNYKVVFDPANFPFGNGQISNQLIDQAVVNINAFGDGAVLVADV